MHARAIMLGFRAKWGQAAAAGRSHGHGTAFRAWSSVSQTPGSSPSLSPFLRQVTDQFTPESLHHGFRVTQIKHVPDYDMVVVALVHEKTGADFLHLAKDDVNNVFTVGFRTIPRDSTGVAHILEHAVLCGSKKYPVRDPFFKMLTRSVSNFMNAMTGSDYTMYPFATQNKADFGNLMDIYMDATFYPNLRSMDFRQEGWRLEHVNVHDPSTPLILKGVVYNEMKGALSDAQSIFSTEQQQAMFPGTTYAHNSGGDPEAIPDLTHEQLKKFHGYHYHPSNAKFITYGTFGLEDHLKAIDEKLAPFEGKLDLSFLSDGFESFKAFTEPKRVTTTCPPDPMGDPEKQSKMIMSFLTHPNHNVHESFYLGVLSQLVIEEESSPMFKALIDSHIGSNYASGTGFDSYTKLTSLSVGLQGIRAEDVPMVEETIMRVFREAREMTFEQKKIDAILHQIELSKKHKNAKFGLHLALGILPGWTMGVDPMCHFDFEEMLKTFRHRFETEPDFFKKLIDKNILENPHRLTFISHPDPEYDLKRQAKEMERLERVSSGIASDEEKENIFRANQALLAEQEASEDLSVLPTLTLADLNRTAVSYPVEHKTIADIPVQWRSTETNGISYLRFQHTNYQNVPSALRFFIPLYTSVLTSIGVKGKDFEDFEHELLRYTGGINSGFLYTNTPHDLGSVQGGLSLSAACLDRYVDKTVELLNETIIRTNFDDLERLKSHILGTSNDLMNSLAHGGSGFAARYAAAALSPVLAYREQTTGITQVMFMNQLAGLDDLSGIPELLKKISRSFMNRRALKCAVVTSDAGASDVHQAMSAFLDAYPESSTKHDNADALRDMNLFSVPSRKTYFPMPFQVNFSAKAFKTVPMMHEDSAKLQILAEMLSSKYLHREIREKNGAYGGGSSFSAFDGTFLFHSYRDPQTQRTLETYENAVTHAMKPGSFTDKDLDEAKITVIGNADAPMNVSSQGEALFRMGITDEMRQTRRDRIFNVTMQDLAQVAAKYLLPENNENFATAVFGQQSDQVTTELFEKAGWHIKMLDEKKTESTTK